MRLRAIGVFHSPFPQKFATPRQPGLVQTPGIIEVFNEFQPEDAFDGLEQYSHLWIIFGFHQIRPEKFRSKIRAPRLNGETTGVFACRSPYRPNPIGLSVVEIKSIDTSTGQIRVLGGDLIDGSPIYDIKPYLPEVEAIPEATQRDLAHPTPVELSWGAGVSSSIDAQLKTEIEELITLDPRPSHRSEDQFQFGMSYRGYNIRFSGEGRQLHIISVEKMSTARYQ